MADPVANDFAYIARRMRQLAEQQEEAQINAATQAAMEEHAMVAEARAPAKPSKPLFPASWP